jgi:ribosomal protein L40E
MKRMNHLLILLLVFVSLTSLVALSNENTRVAQAYTEMQSVTQVCVANSTTTQCGTFSSVPPPSITTEQPYVVFALVIGALLVAILALWLRQRSRSEPKSTPQRPREEKNYCKKCGSKLPEDADFCIKCGTKQ